jgi:hypothetical protein
MSRKCSSIYADKCYGEMIWAARWATTEMMIHTTITGDADDAVTLANDTNVSFYKLQCVKVDLSCWLLPSR